MTDRLTDGWIDGQTDGQDGYHRASTDFVWRGPNNVSLETGIVALSTQV